MVKRDQITIIIPVFNEADNIVGLLEHLLANANPTNISEIIMVDGGSTDGSLDVISAFLTRRIPSEEEYMVPLIQINSQKGRAKQMNAGAKIAKGSVLYFLHADSFPPQHYDDLILTEIEKNNSAGCFRLKFNSNHWWLSLAGWLTKFNWRASRGGDQSQYITQSLFNDIGGFDENYIIYEDNILINELYKRNEFTVMQQKIKTSARRYEEHGIWTLQYHFWTIYVKKWFGASPDELYKYYLKYIAKKI